MRKRTVLSIIFTFLITLISNKFWLVMTDGHTSFKFDIFVIIIVLSFLLFYKLTDYIADFKTVLGKSRIDIIFLTIFFIFLFIPMSHINKSDISEQENRYLTKFKPFIINGKINFAFGDNFENWFNDRFCFRQTFINIHNSILPEKMPENGILDDTTGFTYTNNLFKHDDINTIQTNLKSLYKFDSFCKKHNIKLYTLIVPSKADIHETKLAAKRISVKEQNKKHEDFIKYIKQVQAENKIKVIYPYEEMKKASKKNLMFFKTEHHWTDDGAFVGYKALMKEIKKDFPDIKILEKNDFNKFYDKNVRGDWYRNFDYGQDCKRLALTERLCKKYHTQEYVYYKHKQYDSLHQDESDIPFHKTKTYYYPLGANYRVIQLGTSQNENLTEFIPFTFKNTKRIRNNNVKQLPEQEVFKIMKYYEKEMLDYKPDIIVFCITTGNIKSLHNLFEKD